MKEDVLTLDVLRRALQGGFPQGDRRGIIHPSIWEDYKKLFNFTEEQMDKYFIKATYIPFEALAENDK